MDNWQRWEREAAAALGLDTTISSGNQFFDKGDATSRERSDPFPLMADCKLTIKGSFSLNRALLAGYQKQAAEAGKRFVLPVRFWTPTRREDYAVLSFHDLVELRDLCR